jgi:hypothetical protein
VHPSNKHQRIAFISTIVPAPVGLFSDDTWTTIEKQDPDSFTRRNQRLVVIGSTPDKIERFSIFSDT